MLRTYGALLITIDDITLQSLCSYRSKNLLNPKFKVQLV